MQRRLTTLEGLTKAVIECPSARKRRLIAVCGAPASGKSTLADALCDRVRAHGTRVCVVPMDGFHLDNALLTAHGSLGRKGAPHTFDSAGFAHLITRCANEEQVYYPTFDRARDISIAGSGVLSHDIDTVIVEGNYLLMQTPGWSDLSELWDLSVYLDVPAEVLKTRLVARWTTHGLSPQEADARAERNDMPNARTVIAQSADADIVYTSETARFA